MKIIIKRLIQNLIDKLPEERCRESIISSFLHQKLKFSRESADETLKMFEILQ